MLKLLGSVLIVAACASFGFSADLRLKRRIEALSSILPVLELLKAEIENLLTPLPDAIASIAKTASYPASELMHSTLDAFRKNGAAISMAFSGTLFENGIGYGFFEDDLAVLYELSPVLGRYSAEEQGNKLSKVIIKLDSLRDNAREEKSRQGRIYKAMGIMTGIVLVLISV